MSDLADEILPQTRTGHRDRKGDKNPLSYAIKNGQGLMAARLVIIIGLPVLGGTLLYGLEQFRENIKLQFDEVTKSLMLLNDGFKDVRSDVKELTKDNADIRTTVTGLKATQDEDHRIQRLEHK